MTVRRGRVLQVKSEEIGAIGAEISSGARPNSQSVSFELMTTGMWKETEFPDEAGRASTVTEVERGRWNDFLFRPGTKMSVSLPKNPYPIIAKCGKGGPPMALTNTFLIPAQIADGETRPAYGRRRWIDRRLSMPVLSMSYRGHLTMSLAYGHWQISDHRFNQPAGVDNVSFRLNTRGLGVTYIVSQALSR